MAPPATPPPTPGADDDADAVLRFWFETTAPGQWFRKDPDFDAEVRRRFLTLTHKALAGQLSPWSNHPSPGLALVLLLDQMPRQIWRDDPRAFAGDPAALALSLRATAEGWVEQETEQARRQFWLMPQMHSEDVQVQRAAVPLFERLCDPRTAAYARRHRDVIERFGRFPHRNAVLGRPSTPEELSFLQEPGSQF
ncbi:conserved hypothetical protein [Cyanobium sp. PCC 7001]|uniref:DUF924 family protein n=1 Tax=Cyanobium sp. PCC 7001 TaxID=180281 RepID=UPI000180514C|nr:DUF924 family protein [Cyanobium sp. PCC 7001]EDY39327.1 conserved hypothetical protein [Cyanobium sp. PCC 7001]